MSEHLVPMVVEETSRGDRAYDIYINALQDPLRGGSSGVVAGRVAFDTEFEGAI